MRKISCSLQKINKIFVGIFVKCTFHAFGEMYNLTGTLEKRILFFIMNIMYSKSVMLAYTQLPKWVYICDTNICTKNNMAKQIKCVVHKINW